MFGRGPPVACADRLVRPRHLSRLAGASSANYALGGAASFGASVTRRGESPRGDVTAPGDAIGPKATADKPGQIKVTWAAPKMDGRARRAV